VAEEIFPEVNLGRRSRHHESPRLVATRCESPGAGVLIKEEVFGVTRKSHPYRPYRNQANWSE
jgi:hypothetical protein